LSSNYERILTELLTVPDPERMRLSVRDTVSLALADVKAVRALTIQVLNHCLSRTRAKLLVEEGQDHLRRRAILEHLTSAY
jgi:hypothetical protein